MKYTRAQLDAMPLDIAGIKERDPNAPDGEFELTLRDGGSVWIEYDARNGYYRTLSKRWTDGSAVGWVGPWCIAAP